jgi:hypothetical protein
MTSAEHLAPEWLVVRYETEPRKNSHERWAGVGWYVVRICPCHWGHCVTRFPYPDRERAEQAREVILSVKPSGIRLAPDAGQDGECPQ